MFELLMIVCFGISWPFNVAKSIRTRSTKGKSLVFLVAIFIGYIFGIINKLLTNPNYVLYAYAFNLLFVGLDLMLYLVNYRAERKGKAGLNKGLQAQ